MRRTLSPVLTVVGLIGVVGAASAAEVRLHDHLLDAVTAGGIAEKLDSGLSSSFSGPVAQRLFDNADPAPDPTPGPRPQPGSSTDLTLGGSSADASPPNFVGNGEVTGGSETAASFVPGVGGTAVARSFGSVDGGGLLTTLPISASVIVIDNN